VEAKEALARTLLISRSSHHCPITMLNYLMRHAVGHTSQLASRKSIPIALDAGKSMILPTAADTYSARVNALHALKSISTRAR